MRHGKEFAERDIQLMRTAVAEISATKDSGLHALMRCCNVQTGK